MKHSILGLCDLCRLLKKIRLYYIPNKIEGKAVWLCRGCRDRHVQEGTSVE